MCMELTYVSIFMKEFCIRYILCQLTAKNPTQIVAVKDRIISAYIGICRVIIYTSRNILKRIGLVSKYSIFNLTFQAGISGFVKG